MQDREYSEFLTAAGKDRACAEAINDFLVGSGCTREIKTAKSGNTVSYLRADKTTLATFVCRKTGVKLRILPRNLKTYEGFLNTLPEKVKKDIVKASACKRLLNPADCNPKCAMGYDFCLDGERYRKCRYMAFMPSLTEESAPFIIEFLRRELTGGQ